MWNDRHLDEDEADKCGEAIPMSERCCECARPLRDDWRRTNEGRICGRCAAKRGELSTSAAERALAKVFEQSLAKVDRAARRAGTQNGRGAVPTSDPGHEHRNRFHTRSDAMTTIAHFPDRNLAERFRSNLIASALIVLAEAIGRTAQTMNGEPNVPFEQWPAALQATCRYEAKAAVSRLDRDAKRQAILRAREQVALELLRRDYSALDRHDQLRVNEYVRVSTRNYDAALEGLLEPLPLGCARRAELEPEAPKVVRS